MNNKIIAFSGGCYSGKTTTIDGISQITNSLVVRENIRDYLTQSISETRKDANGYFYLQLKIITQKVCNEWIAWFKAYNYDFILIDRSLADSMFYYTCEVDYDGLKWFNKVLYVIYYYILNLFVWLSFKFIYDKVLLFKPLKFNGEDIFYRPKNLNNRKEYNNILKITIKYVNILNSKVQIFNLSNPGELNMICSLLEIKTYYS